MVIIVGGGIAGLCCGLELHRNGVKFSILESSDGVGGRMRTDHEGGFLLDRGFQVLLTAYPEAKRILDYEKLELSRFEPGAMVRYDGRFHKLVDPIRRPASALETALSPIASLADKMNLGRLRHRLCAGSLSSLANRNESSIVRMLRDEGFTERFVDSFFRPFMGGVCLDAGLLTSSRVFDFTFRMFASEDVALPKHGIQAIPNQVAEQLPAESIRLEHTVETLTRSGVRLSSGEELSAEQVVVATEGPVAAKLLGKPVRRKGRPVVCVYYVCDKAPINEAILVLNGEKSGPINNLCVCDVVCPGYSSSGQSLVSVSVLDSGTKTDDHLEREVRSQLVDWFSPVVQGWRHLKTYRIPYALPIQTPTQLNAGQRSNRIDDRTFICGDHCCGVASINGAMESGRLAAEAVLTSRGGGTT